jgi:hypothetical protein
MKKLRFILTFVAVTVCCVVSAGRLTAQQPATAQMASLPTYEITGGLATAAKATTLAGRLHLPAEKLVQRNGMISFIDTVNHLAVPTVAVTDAAILDAHRKATKNYYPQLAIEVKGIDYAALSKVSALDSDKALKLASDAFESAGLTPQLATPVVGHTVFKTVSSGATGAPVSTSTNLDTQVSYRFTLKGVPLVGPGAKVQVSYDANGNVIRLIHATRTLKEGPAVKIISADEMRARLVKSLPKNTDVKLRLVYWAPPLTLDVNSSAAWNPKAIIPWYAVTTTTHSVATGTTPAHSITARVRLIPATEDPRYVPTVTLTASARERSLVEAHVAVTGGTPPYTYLWAGSNPDASTNTSDSIRYIPVVRDYRAILRTQSLERNEHVVVSVIDANGVLIQAEQSVPVLAQPAAGSRGDRGSVTYGCESPNDPGPSVTDGSYAPERIAWQQAMGASGAGGGTQNFCWLADSSWPGDYIEPVPPGSLPSSPWINGDADFSNWGINTANIMLYNGDGSPNWIAEMYPGANVNDYNSSNGGGLNSPGDPSGTVLIGSASYAVNYNGSWGAPAANDQLQWLVMYACQVLEADSAAPTPWLRWGPAFNGLHSMVGFETEASDAGVGFMGDFPHNILGVGTSPQTIVQGWLNAAIADDMGTPAAMGPIENVTIHRPFGWPPIVIGISDYGDYYWGKGSVGPTIPKSAINGWWYIQGTDSLQEYP